MLKKHVSSIYKMVTVTKYHVSEDIPENVTSFREAFANEMETAVIYTDLEIIQDNVINMTREQTQHITVNSVTKAIAVDAL